ncbi:MAG: penicillin acylase family protein [Pseudomonadales bacterium]
MKILIYSLLALLLLLVGAWFYTPYLDRYEPSGQVDIAELSAPVRIVRDDKGIPYVFAENLDDVVLGQGFVMAQDRLFQIHMMRLLAQGRLSELIGEAGLPMDTLVRVLNIPAIGRKQTALLSSEERRYYQRYIDGVNAYLRERGDELTLPLRSKPPPPWTLDELITSQVFNYWGSTVNWREELLSQALIDHLGVDVASQISQITINADDEHRARSESNYSYQRSSPVSPRLPEQHDSSDLLDPLPAPDHQGSNTWITGPAKSVGGMPIVASDPHIDARRLPGFWYPIGLITPELRAVGAGVGGSPGIGIGRTDDIAWGITNGYGDMVDLYIEKIDPHNPDNYLEGKISIPFTVREEIIRIKDSDSPDGFRQQLLTVRATGRGPIITDHKLGQGSSHTLSMRWAAPEFMGPRMSARDLLLAKNVDQALTALGHAAMPLTYVVADMAGNIARTGTGFIPRRVRGDGAAPLPVVDSSDSWDGRIPSTEMPQVLNPEQHWLGSANHRILAEDYPHHYSTFFAHSWRYRRIREQMHNIDQWATADHWQLQLDTKNMFAERLAPIMAQALLQYEETQQLGELLSQWNYIDDATRPEPLIFQSMLRHYAKAVVIDELGEGLSKQYLNDYYYWHERITKITMDENSSWLDDITTEKKETRDDLFVRAGHSALTELVALYGDNPERWSWGEAHTITFSHPLISGKLAANWLGGGTYPAHGSGETLNRAAYKYGQPYETTFFASMRMVMDLADSEKIEAHIPGGVSERLFDPHMTNMLPNWVSGKPDYWWFSDEAIEAHAVSEMVLTP